MYITHWRRETLFFRNDLAPRKELSQEEIDDDLLWRIEYQLVQTNDCIDIKELRTELQKGDTKQCGLLGTTLVRNYILNRTKVK